MFLAGYLQRSADAAKLGIRFLALVPKQVLAESELGAAVAVPMAPGRDHRGEVHGEVRRAADAGRPRPDDRRMSRAARSPSRGRPRRQREGSSRCERPTAEPAARAGQARARFLELVGGDPAELHRYCARLTGSVVEGEDIVQDTLAKAYYAISMAKEMPPLRPFLFRIAHNTAMDVPAPPRAQARRAGGRAPRGHHRRRAAGSRGGAGGAGDVPGAADRPAKRGHPEGRPRLHAGGDRREHGREPAGGEGGAAPRSGGAARPRRSWRRRGRGAPEGARSAGRGARFLHRYATLFNARDWEALRLFIAEDCRLDLVSRAERRGPGGRRILHPLRRATRFPRGPWRPRGRRRRRRPALAILSPRASQHPSTFVLLDWRGEPVALIRDFRYVPYIADEVAQGRAAFRPVDGALLVE